MSTDFIALFDNSLPEISLNQLFSRLIATPQFAAPIVEHYKEAWQVKRWLIEESDSLGPALRGPGGFVIRLEPRTVKMYHMMRFSTFTGDVFWRNELRNACLEMANWIGSRRAIYTHELSPHEGEGLAQIESSLRAQVGPPAVTFEELSDAEYFGPRSWYIDTFADLQAT